MHIHCKYSGLKGFLTVYNDAVRYQYMITEKALTKAKALVFWEKYGIDATIEAFGIKRRTLFLWKSDFIKGNKKVESLNEKKRTPKNKRKRIWNEGIVKEIERLRDTYPNLGKDKLHFFLSEFCNEQKLKCPSITTIGRIIKDKGGLRKSHKTISHYGVIKKTERKKRLIKPKDFKAEYPGHMVSLDTVMSCKWNRKRYVITFEDIFTRISLAMGTSSHGSRAAKEFFVLCRKAFPFPINSVLTDNGSEFAKEFNQELIRLYIEHYHTYPKTPKMNSHCERFNRTLREEFLNYNTFELAEDVNQFNNKLLDYLNWYNTRRPHFAFKNKKSPVQYAIDQLEINNHFKNSEKCKIGWTYTAL